MDEPLKPPSQQPKRFFDIVPSKLAFPPATSRPIIPGSRTHPADPMMTTGQSDSAGQTEIETDEPVDTDSTPATGTEKNDLAGPTDMHQETPAGDEMIEQEYEEVKHELPAGLPVAEVQAHSSSGTAGMATPTNQVVVVHHESSKHHHPRLREYVWLTVIIALLIVAADLLLDSGIWKPGHHLPHTHFWH
jgi:hypothetical protein